MAVCLAFVVWAAWNAKRARKRRLRCVMKRLAGFAGFFVFPAAGLLPLVRLPRATEPSEALEKEWHTFQSLRNNLPHVRASTSKHASAPCVHPKLTDF